MHCESTDTVCCFSRGVIVSPHFDLIVARLAM